MAKKHGAAAALVLTGALAAGAMTGVTAPSSAQAMTSEQAEIAAGHLAEAFAHEAGLFSRANIELARNDLISGHATKGEDADWDAIKFSADKVRRREIENALAIAREDLAYARTATSDLASVAFLRSARAELKQALDLQSRPFTWTAIGENDKAMEAYSRTLLKKIGVEAVSAPVLRPS